MMILLLSGIVFYMCSEPVFGVSFIFPLNMVWCKKDGRKKAGGNHRINSGEDGGFIWTIY